MVKRCDVCGKLLTYHSRKKKYFDPSDNGDFACSSKCVLAWIRRRRAITDIIVDRESVLPVNLCQAHDVYSDSLKMCFRSAYEMHVAEFMLRHGIKFFYEPFTFRISQTATYTPDFYIPEKRCLIEVKGRWTNKTKIKKFRDKFKTPLLVVTWIIKNDFYQKARTGNIT